MKAREGKPQAARVLLRIPKALAYVNGVITEKTLRQWIWERKIESVRIGRAVCIPQDSLDRIIERGTTPALER
jgi:excisionase family DNA binding protein